ncbi:ABC transporter ATP-binding protein [Hathewaya massiliensis]|uniref:ATP-binding cassette domain-containing protein n=1 Tax=Hathewaya massiliensis TaxID=1964382 RepID=UPI0011571340|nr:ABC transporter ATP-binding protein [Hathewaya massiliensis]
MIKIKNLKFAYDGENNIFQDLSFDIKPGYVYSLLGINGAGKTTLLKLMNGDLHSNIDLSSYEDEILYIHDEMKFYEYLTGYEFINFILSLKKMQIDESKYNMIVDKLLMKEKIKEPISNYSFGMKHKLVLIMSFLLNYRYILLDEPFTSLDAIASDAMINVAREYTKAGNTIVISTHMLDIAQEISDKILLLQNGKIQEFDNNFKSSSEIKKIILS